MRAWSRLARVIGLDGDADRVARVRQALATVARVFPEHLAKPQPPTWFEPHEIAQNEQFDAIVRAHKKDRLALPIQALLRTGATYHNLDQMHLRRLAWFVPSLLAAWLDRDETAVDADEISRIFESTALVEGAYWAWTEDEAAALADFFGGAIHAALATALPPERAPARPPENGLHVWSRHAPSVPLQILRLARAMHVAEEPLVSAWVDEETPLALEHLLEAVFDPTVAAKRYLAHEIVADRLADAFFAATGDRALRLSKAEVHVRRWIARREDEEAWP